MGLNLSVKHRGSADYTKVPRFRMAGVMPPRVLIVLGSILTASFALHAQSAPPADAPPVNAAAVLTELKQIQERQQAAKRQQLQGATTDLIAAARTNDAATRAYADAMRETEFAGNTQRFIDWRDRNKEALGTNKAVGTAARLHLQYLVLSLNRAANPKAPPPLKEVWDYVVQLAAARQQFERELTSTEPGRVLLERPITDSPIVKARLLKPELEKLKDWEMVAGSVDGIIEKNLRSALRSQKDPRLLDTWTLQIDYRRRAADKAEGNVTLATFEQIEYPRLMWRRAKDIALLGQTNRATSEMLALVRKYPSHPDLNDWVEDLTNRLSAGGSGAKPGN